MRVGLTVDLSETGTPTGKGEEVVKDERMLGRGVLVLLVVLTVQVIFLAVVFLLAVGGFLPMDEEALLRLWFQTMPKPFGYW